MIIDGGWVDLATLVAACAASVVKPLRSLARGNRMHIDRSMLMSDFLTGASLVPFILMVGAAVSPTLLSLIFETNRVFIALGGLIGLILVAGEIWNNPRRGGTDR
jgi:uncharacterized membrane protein YdcZ (DUF606 family)